MKAKPISEFRCEWYVNMNRASYDIFVRGPHFEWHREIEEFEVHQNPGRGLVNLNGDDILKAVYRDFYLPFVEERNAAICLYKQKTRDTRKV